MESVKEAQAEIDARQQLVIDMHKQSQTFQRAANNIQKEKTGIYFCVSKLLTKTQSRIGRTGEHAYRARISAPK